MIGLLFILSGLLAQTGAEFSKELGIPYEVLLILGIVISLFGASKTFSK
jgi:hypothetical protein